MKGKIFIFFVLLICVVKLPAETEGERLFRENKTEKAIITLENDVKLGNVGENTYNFLGLAYYQLQNYEKSIEIFEKGLECDGVNKIILFYNLGNSYFMTGNFMEAIKSYDSALKIDGEYSSAFLNKANCEVQTGLFENAVSDYENFLKLEPKDIQRPQIEELICLLREEIRIQKENERIAQLQRKAEEEAEMAKLVQMISDDVESELQEIARRDEEERIRMEELKRIENEKNNLSEESNEASSMIDIIEENDSDEELLQAVEEDSMLQQAIEIENQRIQKEKDEEIRLKKIEEEKEKIRKEAEEAEKKLQQENMEKENIRKEEMKKAESERRRKLLEDIANSLQDNDEQNMNASSGDIIEYEYESELE